MVKKKEKKVPHPCRFLGDLGILCANEDVIMDAEYYEKGDPKIMHQIPEREDCIACLLANILTNFLVQIDHGKLVSFMKGKDK